jgi:hypothetical protein
MPMLDMGIHFLGAATRCRTGGMDRPVEPGEDANRDRHRRALKL